MAIRIFLMGKKKSYPQGSAWGKIQSSRLKALRLRQSVVCEASSEEKILADLSVESDAVSGSMQALLRMRKQLNFGRIPALVVTVTVVAISAPAWAGPPS